jgi:Ser/Thr protein kinase RdoA (MazF antagonist)
MIAPAGLGVDRTVPGLGIAMSREALMGLLGEHLPECRAGMQILDARVVDVQYTPGCGAQVLWKLSVQDPETGRTGRQLVFVQALRRDEPPPPEPRDLVARYTVLRGRKGLAREMPLRTPWLLVRPAHVLVHAFPLDPLLPTLMEIADPQAMREALHRAWHPRRVRVRQVRIDTLSYTPGARAAVRYDVLSEDKDTGLPEVRRLVGKLDVKRLPTRLFAGHWALWRQALGRVSVAPPAGYVAVARLSLQEFLTGTRLSELAGSGAFVGLVRETARAIARVHALTLPLLARRDPEKEMSTVDRWTTVLKRLRPAHGRRLDSLARRLRGELAARLRIEATVHGDFHLANVLADEQGVTLIDWDQMAHGDPMVDVGRVLASLRVSSLRLHGTIEGLADVQDGFLGAYLDATHGDERRARLFEAVALLVSAAAPFRLQREGWEQGAELMLDEVERTFELSLAGTRIYGTPPDLEREVPFEARPEWALNRPYAQALLVPVIHQSEGADIEVTECLPALQEQRRDRFQVRWSLKGHRGKARWRGSLNGIGFPGDSGRGRLRRLELATAVLQEHPGALQLPRPLGHLAPLSMIVFAAPRGHALATLLGTPLETQALGRTAAALAYFHSLRMDLRKERETAREVRSARRRIGRLEQAGHPSAPEVRALLDRLEPVLAARGERRAATILGLHPQHLRIADTSAAASLFVDVLWADPLLAAGGLLAHLATAALSRGHVPSAAGEFRRAYANAAGCGEDCLRTFEALALLSRACRVGLKPVGGPALPPIIRYAGSLVAGT